MSTTLAFLGSIATSVMTLVGVFVGSRLSYGRSIKEKFWDVRREAYSAILSKLAEVDRITKGGDDWIAAQGLKNYDRLGEDRDKIAKHMIVVWQKYSDNHLVMSDEFVRIFENFISENDAGDPNDATASLHLSRTKIITKYRALLLAQARKELAHGAGVGSQVPRRIFSFLRTRNTTLGGGNERHR